MNFRFYLTHCYLIYSVALLLILLDNSVCGEEFRVGKTFVSGSQRPKYVPDEILVAFRPGISDQIKYQIHEQCGSAAVYPSFSGCFELVRFHNGKSAEEMIKVYEREHDVDYAEPNYIAHAFFFPNDPLYNYQWHLHSPDKGGTNMERAWDISTGKGVIVAVLDTGVAYEDYQSFRQAPDLKGASFVPGYDFVNSDTHPNDENGHGTHVTAIIAQRTNNNIGLAGAAFNCSIMPVRVLDEDGYGNYFSITNGVDFAVKKGAKVINMSMGSDQPSKTLERSLARAYDMGVILVAAAGNDFQKGSPVSYPADYDTYCITVGAVRYDWTRAPYSNVGDYMDLSAPGGDLSQDQNGDNNPDGILQETFINDPKRFNPWFFEGTSMAAPQVSAAAAILISHGVTNPSEVAEALMYSARDMGPLGWDREYGWGVLDAYAALNYVSRSIRDIGITTVSVPKEIVRGETATLIVTVRNNGTRHEDVEISVKNDAGNDFVPRQKARVGPASSCKFTFQLDTSGMALGGNRLSVELNQLPEEASIANNSEVITLFAISKASRIMYVKSVQVEKYKHYVFWSAVATVTVVSGEESPVEGALVSGMWSGPLGQPDSVSTDVNGMAIFHSGPLFGGEIDFTVYNVSKTGWSLKWAADSSGNSFTSASAQVSGFVSVDSQTKCPVTWSELKDRQMKSMPDSTEFYQNYPNPFNSETWIPYQMVKGDYVLIRIYDSTGRLIRQLDLGYKSAGYYLDKARAVYWDGKNDSGERIKSGIYFYEIKAGQLGLVKKMVVLE